MTSSSPYPGPPPGWQPGPPPQPARPTSVPVWPIVGLVGALLIVVGSMGPWAQARVFTAEFSVSGLKGDGVITLVLSLTAAVFLGVGGFLPNLRWAFWPVVAALIAAGVCLLFGLIDTVNIGSKLNSGTELAGGSIGWGLVLVLLGSAVAVTGSVVHLILCLKKPSTPAVQPGFPPGPGMGQPPFPPGPGYQPNQPRSPWGNPQP